ncbi:MAG: DinB family protein [Planctomycetota bacterium]
MKFELQPSLRVLEATPATVRALLTNAGEPWIHNNYGKDTFSPFDVVGHFIHGEKADWIPRLERLLQYGESREFDAFDRFAQFKDSQGKSIHDLLDEFTILRAESLRKLNAASITNDKLQLRGKHPTLGTVTLENLLATWVVHDLNHISQITRAMAYQYKAEVGPWRAYLGILQSFQS